MTRWTSWKRALMFGALTLAVSTPAVATTPEDFNLSNGAELLHLCMTKPDDPLYSAAIHMCHGFGAGVYRTVQAMTVNAKLDPLFCPASKPFTRNEAVQEFIQWAHSNMQHATESAVDFLGRFFIEKLPCPK